MRKFFLIVLIFLSVFLSACGKQATPSPSPVPTVEFNPPPGTPVPPPTAAATKVPATGSTLLIQDDQTALFTDFDGEYSLVIPQGWIAARINQKEFIQLEMNEGLQNPEFQALLGQVKMQNSEIFRVHAFDLREGHTDDSFIPRFYVTLNNKSQETLPEAMESLAKFLAKTYPQGVTATYLRKSTATGLEYGLVEYRAPKVKQLNSMTVDIYMLCAIFFPAEHQQAILEMDIPKSMYEQLRPDFNEIIYSFKPLKQ